jgi:hypothetical protein
MSKNPSLAHLKKGLDERRNKIKEEFERKVEEAKKKTEDHKKIIDAEKKKRDAKIAKIEESFGKKANATLKKRLGKEDFKRLQEWLLKKREEEIRKLEAVRTKNEESQRQLAELKETDSEDFMIYYFKSKSNLEQELKEDIGLDV